jgi:flagellar hook protein FlgE
MQANGTFDINPSDLNKLAPINVRGLGSAVAQTNNVEVNANLDRDTPISADEVSYTPGAMASYADDPAAAGVTKPDFTLEMNVIDSMGGTHKIAMAFMKSDDNVADPNQWHAEIYSVPASDIQAGLNGVPGLISAGDVLFDQNGKIDLVNSTLFGAGPNAPAELNIGASVSSSTIAWADGLGIGGQNITLDLDKLGQLAKGSTVSAVNSNGAGVGNVVGVEVDEAGIVSAIYDNSQIRKIAKVAVATFPNADGLKAVSGNAYKAAAAAGQLVIKEPGVGAGTISPSSLEASTVDLSAEFTGLIMTQKAYSASSKIITTADQMLEELLNIKR